MAKMTVAELKRRIQPGVKIRSVWVPNFSMFAADHPFYTEVGTVVRAMATQFTVNRPYKGPQSESYMDFPKASELEATDKGFRITKLWQVYEYEFVADAPEPAAPFILRSSEGVNYGASATLEAAKDHARLICLKGYEIWHKGTPVVVVEPHRYLSPAPGEVHTI